MPGRFIRCTTGRMGKAIPSKASPTPSARSSSRITVRSTTGAWKPWVCILFSRYLQPVPNANPVVGSQVTAAGLAAAIDFLWYALIATLVSVSAVHRALARFSGYLDVGFGICLGGVATWIAISLI